VAEEAITRRWKASRIVKASSPSRAVGVKRSSAPPKVGAQALAGAHERGDGDRGVRGMVVRFTSGKRTPWRAQIERSAEAGKVP